MITRHQSKQIIKIFFIYYIVSLMLTLLNVYFSNESYDLLEIIVLSFVPGLISSTLLIILIKEFRSALKEKNYLAFVGMLICCLVYLKFYFKIKI